MNYDKGYFDSPEFREILKRYEQARRLNTTLYFGIDELTDLFSYCLSIDKQDEAREIFSLAKRLHPSSPECNKLEIKLLLHIGEPQKAMRLLSALGETIDCETKLLKAEIFLSLKDFKQARDVAIEILRDQQSAKDYAYEALEILLDCGFAPEALIICESILHINPTQRNMLEVKAECLIELQRINEAVDIYNKLLDEEPYNAFYWEQLGHIYYMVKKYGKALECFEYESTINEEIEYAKMMQAYCYYYVRDYKRAIEIFENFSKKYPKSTVPLFYIALSHYHEGKKEEAKDIFNSITSIAAEGTAEMMLARINKAMILDELGDTARADEAMAMAILMHPDNIKQTILRDKHIYELRDKENLTFDDMNVLEIKDWTLQEELYILGEHLVEHRHLILAKRVFNYIREFSPDTSDIDAYIAYILWNTDKETDITTQIENALDGRSCILFELFDIPYNSSITARDFIAQIK